MCKLCTPIPGFCYPDGRYSSDIRMEPVPSKFFSSCLIGRNLLLTNEKEAGEKGQFLNNGKRDENRSHPENIPLIRRISTTISINSKDG